MVYRGRRVSFNLNKKEMFQGDNCPYLTGCYLVKALTQHGCRGMTDGTPKHVLHTDELMEWQTYN